MKKTIGDNHYKRFNSKFSLNPHRFKMWLKDRRRNRKFRRQRLERGFCDGDLWNFDEYIIRLIADGLREYVKQTNGYPDQSFKTFEDWCAYLTSIADDLDWIRVDSTDNEYWDDKFLKGNYPEEEHKWFERIKEIDEAKRLHIQNGLKDFIEVYEDIWW